MNSRVKPTPNVDTRGLLEPTRGAPTRETVGGKAARALVLLVSLLWVAAMAPGCGSDGPGPVDSGTAPEFALVDVNPSSPTFSSTRALDETPGVVVLYFVHYG